MGIKFAESSVTGVKWAILLIFLCLFNLSPPIGPSSFHPLLYFFNFLLSHWCFWLYVISCHVRVSQWIYTLLLYSSLNASWVFVYKLSDCGFECRSCHLNYGCHTSFEQGFLWHSGKLQSVDLLWNLYVTR